MTPKHLNEYDVVVVGSGPGGATVGRELARAGKRVAILESGSDDQRLGSYLTALRVLSMERSKEGLPMLRARTTGGASVFYSASAADPPPWLAPRYGIDLFPLLDEIKSETKAGVLPENLLGRASIKVMETANKIGYKWEPMAKFLDPHKFANGLCCGANEHLGCRCGAKWTAREYLKDAVAAGANLMIHTECTEVVVDDGVAVGVRARLAGGGEVELRAGCVVLSAGGLSTPLLLQKAGIDRAGKGCFTDPTVVVYGVAPFEGTWQDPPVSVVTWEFYDNDGIRIGTIMEPKWMFALSMLKQSPKHVSLAMSYRNIVGILVKVKDELSGEVRPDGTVSKALGEPEWDRLNKGIVVAKNILRALECKPQTIVVGEAKGAHPSGTCRIGDVLDNNLQTEIKNLYACDASIFPEALDRPTVLTIIAFGKRLSKHLLAG
ncbi:MAG: GMC family oxidoreductase [Candidatus Abyssobacteria bacterium SURF_5]|uniref:GMC family oxidoreductase n=1 Tax=Abyssobacteria bacterium (strain SURF_5) TaxID=2093360 RepID=A0A3A4N5A5_ABYX5|nr:MAG: GMC family oxidoreductase [Candidatus Abyssubacteria bacterium SURF_5]